MIALLVIAICGVVFNGWIATRIDGHLAAMQLYQEKKVSTTITWASGNTTVVTTERSSPEETIEQLSARHYNEVLYVRNNPPPGEHLP